jgi:dCTP deaminase
MRTCTHCAGVFRNGGSLRFVRGADAPRRKHMSASTARLVARQRPLRANQPFELQPNCGISSWVMAIKSDNWIRRMAEQHGMIEPFEPQLVNRAGDKKVVSYGTSSYGYDVRCAREFKVFTNLHSTVVDPKNFDPKAFVDVVGDECIIPPNSFALARTVEYFRIPRSVLTICLGKSTYARCGIIVNVTPLEPEWEGHVTLEFSNTTTLPARIYANEGVAQMLFFESDEICATSYKDRGGKYQGQRGVTLPKT